MNPPDNLPPLPPVPDGFDRWDYRGTDWQDHNRQVTYSAIEVADHKRGWHPAFTFETGVYGAPDFHYIEAVRDAPAIPTPEAIAETRQFLDDAFSPAWTMMICALCGRTFQATEADYRARKCGECIERERILGCRTSVEPAMNPPDDINLAVSASLFALLDPENSEDLDQPATGVEARVCEDSPTPSRYRWTHEGVTFDFYRLCDILGITSHAQAHALKKVIRAGRGGKTLMQDIDEAIDAMRRFREMVEEDAPAERRAE